MNQWLNQSHPLTLKAAVILGYLSAVFGLLRPSSITLLLYLGIGAGAFVTANNKRWGYYLLAVCASLIVLLLVVGLLFAAPGLRVIGWLQRLTGLVFPSALAVAILHIQSREYQKIWFE